MPSIKITQEVKEKNARYNYAWLINATLDSIILRGLPDKFFVTSPCSGGYPTRTDLHEADGWQTPVIPSGYNPETQKLGAIVDIDGIHTYTLIDLTPQQIEQRILSQAESAREQKLQEQTIKQADESFQSITDVDVVLENSDAYPLWRNFDDGYAFNIDFKVQDFNADNELKVYSVIQAHQKQDNWFPRNVPALFVLVQPVGATEWEVGAAYLVGDIRTYLGIEYICLQSHTSIAGWQPPNVPALWALN